MTYLCVSFLRHVFLTLRQVEIPTEALAVGVADLLDCLLDEHVGSGDEVDQHPDDREEQDQKQPKELRETADVRSREYVERRVDPSDQQWYEDEED